MADELAVSISLFPSTFTCEPRFSLDRDPLCYALFFECSCFNVRPGRALLDAMSKSESASAVEYNIPTSHICFSY